MKDLPPRVPMAFRDGEVTRSPEARARDRTWHLQDVKEQPRQRFYDPYADL